MIYSCIFRASIICSPNCIPYTRTMGGVCVSSDLFPYLLASNNSGGLRGREGEPPFPLVLSADLLSRKP